MFQRNQISFSAHSRRFNIVSLYDRVVACRPLSAGIEFRILCLEASVILFISLSLGGYLGPVWPICAERWPINSIHLFVHLSLTFCPYA